MARLTHKYILSALAVPLAALVVAGCGSGSNSSTLRTPGGKATVNVAKTALGNVLVDAQGRTLYLFKKDAAGKSACFGECANDWPPVRVTANPTVGGGLAAAKAMTTARQDGKPGVTYNGHPLYRFEGDHKPGDTTGEGVNAFGGKWYAVSPDGAQISAKAATPSTTSGGGYGSGY
jgi:predicted lipoprotein with Yx(FWY)xxD motif